MPLRLDEAWLADQVARAIENSQGGTSKMLADWFSRLRPDRKALRHILRRGQALYGSPALTLTWRRDQIIVSLKNYCPLPSLTFQSRSTNVASINSGYEASISFKSCTTIDKSLFFGTICSGGASVTEVEKYSITVNNTQHLHLRSLRYHATTRMSIVGSH